MDGPSIVTPTADAAGKTARIRSLEQSIQHAALGHAAALYETKIQLILEQMPPAPDGFGYRVIRIVKPDCADCGGAGIRYHLEQEQTAAPLQVEFVNGGLAFTQPRSAPFIALRECGCVRYEAHTIKRPPEPEPAEFVPPQELGPEHDV